MNTRINAKDIPSLLKTKSEEATLVKPTLSKALQQIYDYFELEKSTLVRLRRNESLANFLVEIIKDSDLIIKMSYLNQEQKQYLLNQLSGAERYWIEQLFPLWLGQLDGKSHIWLEKIKSGQFVKMDHGVMNQVIKELLARNVSCACRFICDLSMATDLIASDNQYYICIQLTSSQSEATLENKVERWSRTLDYWYIRRGLFVRYSQGIPSIFAAIAQKIIIYMDERPEPMREEIVVS
ncbi:hypothetical protein PCC7418_0016 [Halothece sp. PCC 7418]|uniref:hypothetical protein n=1 Tax=Halothece sp. (strain PCC 7418) TaxID=65093 RepID=UPI0002A079C2|nr:hypothetical protein [Halothece sp. PCC 7418]AFZ42274.1 hypothetical protein PCC7418_0016 [Halothece sp. PCC 7418]